MFRCATQCQISDTALRRVQSGEGARGQVGRGGRRPERQWHPRGMRLPKDVQRSELTEQPLRERRFLRGGLRDHMTRQFVQGCEPEVIGDGRLHRSVITLSCQY